ncbi:hypothetical protein [Paenibacillus donghaensis]|uniref:Uncharacterized protein n=1 Tax=Paenibacillus donghaensis TaxID=414771 RepID=A0A2Z2KA28_9BACL|nr:hypothetical protein [Paenibacillus donghaensis]ASA19730.1 hypothetical protein B9T62_02220 [Paenibacillus donghaensis]
MEETVNDGLVINHKEQLQFEFILKVNKSAYNHSFTLELKVGVKRLYVVSKISNFLEHLEQGKPLYFTKQFTFDPLNQE